MQGYVDKKSPISAYQPSSEVIAITHEVKEDYDTGVRILQKPYLELNNRSVIEDENRGQEMFNAFVDTDVEDANEAWKWRGTRSMARNKGIAMHANLTANFILPLFVAQNSDSEVDREMSEVMQSCVEWLAEPINSDYQQSFIQIVFAMETNPVTFMQADYCEVKQTIKEKKEDGTYTTKEIMDSVLSGFKSPIWSSSQILINNAYERNLQKQKCLISRRYVDYHEMEAEHKDHENWEYVTPGIKSLYSEEDGLFHDVKDDDAIGNLVAEEIYYNRRRDCQIVFINGIYMGDQDTNGNAIRHRDPEGAPKYNFVDFGFSRIGEHFFYYKSMMNSLGWDNMRYDALDELVYNRALLEVSMPIAVSGTEKIDSEVIFPNAVISLEDKDSRVTPLLPASNMGGALTVLQNIEQSMSEGSVSQTISGQLPDASQKAYTVAQARSDAKKLIGSVGKALGSSMVRFGDLMKDIVMNHLTVPQVEELVGDKMVLKYRTFSLANKMSGGKPMDKIIKFDPSLIGSEMTPQEKRIKSIELLEASGYPKTKKAMTLVNPELFRTFKYHCKIDITEMFTKTNDYMSDMLSELRAQLAGDPYIKLWELDRKLVYAKLQSEGDDIINEDAISQQQQPKPQDQPMANPADMSAQPQPATASPMQPQVAGTSPQNVIQ